MDARHPLLRNVSIFIENCEVVVEGELFIAKPVP